MEAFGVNGGDGMIIFYEYLINEALRIVDLKGSSMNMVIIQLY